METDRTYALRQVKELFISETSLHCITDSQSKRPPHDAGRKCSLLLASRLHDTLEGHELPRHPSSRIPLCCPPCTQARCTPSHQPSPREAATAHRECAMLHRLQSPPPWRIPPHLAAPARGCLPPTSSACYSAPDSTNRTPYGL